MSVAVLADICIICGISQISFTKETAVIEKAGCIPATYPDASTITPMANLSTFLQGDVDLALVYAYILPLSDGGLGGWSSWPLVNPMPSFSVNGDGVVYGIKVTCGDPTTATTSLDGTGIYMSSSSVSGNTLDTTFQIYMPTGSVNSKLDTGTGVNQVCTASVKLGSGSVTYAYTSDEWEMVTFSTINDIKVAGAPLLTQGDSKKYSYSQYSPFLTSKNLVFSISFFTNDACITNVADEYSLAPVLQKLLQNVFAQDFLFLSSQGAPFCNLLSWATLPDGFYYTDLTWKGLATAIGVVSHYMLFQYDGSASATCNYSGLTGSGRVTSNSSILQVGSYMCLVEIILVLVTLGWLSANRFLNKMTDIAFIFLSNPVLFAHAFRKNIDDFFLDANEATYSNPPTSVIKDVYESRLFFGGDARSPTPSSSLALGSMGSIVPLSSRNARIIFPAANGKDRHPASVKMINKE